MKLDIELKDIYGGDSLKLTRNNEQGFILIEYLPRSHSIKVSIEQLQSALIALRLK